MTPDDPNHSAHDYRGEQYERDRSDRETEDEESTEDDDVKIKCAEDNCHNQLGEVELVECDCGMLLCPACADSDRHLECGVDTVVVFPEPLPGELMPDGSRIAT